MGADMSGNPPYPTELIQRDQWCLWRIEPTKNGGPTKVPYRPDGRKAASNDPRTWSTFAEGVEGFLANADAMFEQADSEAVQWESFLLTLAQLFDGEPFRVTDVVQRLEARALLGGNADSKGLREALPDFLAEAGDRTGGFFQRRLARCFAERAGRRFGESQVFLERADGDRKAKVLRWKVVKLR
jgi:hypothetical protein